MNNVAIILSLTLILLGSVNLLLAYWGFTKRKFQGALEFSLFLISVSIYAFGYALEISYSELSAVLFAVKIEYLGIPYLSYFAVLFSYRFVMGKPVKRWLIIILGVIPVTSTILVFFIENHNLFYIDPQIIDTAFFPVLTFKNGLFYNIRFIYQELISLVCIFFLINRFRLESKTKRIQISAIILAQLLPGGISVLYLLGLFPVGLDVNPFTSFIVSAVFSIAILKFGFFEIIPEGRFIALESINEAFVLIDKTGFIQDFNRAAGNLKFIVLEIGNYLPGDNEFSNLVRESIRNGKSGFEFQYKDGDDLFYYRININKVASNSGREYGNSIIIHDYTEFRRLLRSLEYKANYDQLTNIKNRQTVIEDLEIEINRARRFTRSITLIMVDIDYFKYLNDTYGHIAGDNMLIGIAGVLKSGLRDFDILGRYGGEEFIIGCPDTGHVEGMKVAERLRALVEEFSLNYNGIDIKVTCSLGVHSFKSDGEVSTSHIIDRADKALYNSKRSGRNRVSFL